MRVARKQAAAVYCGVALAALEVEIAQVRGVAVRTSLLTKNKGKKMKKTIPPAAKPKLVPGKGFQVGPAGSDPVRSKMSFSFNETTNLAPATPDPTPENPTSAASGPVPALSSGSPQGMMPGMGMFGMMAGMGMGMPGGGMNPIIMMGMCQMFASEKLLHQDNKKVPTKVKAGQNLKELSERNWPGVNWCETWRKRSNTSGTWEVRAHPSTEASERFMAKMKKLSESKNPSASAQEAMEAILSDVCCSKKQSSPTGCCG